MRVMVASHVATDPFFERRLFLPKFFPENFWCTHCYPQNLLEGSARARLWRGVEEPDVHLELADTTADRKFQGVLRSSSLLHPHRAHESIVSRKGGRRPHTFNFRHTSLTRADRVSNP